MIAQADRDAAGGRILVVADVDRLLPVVRENFAAVPSAGVHTYLAGIAQIPQAATRAVLVGHDNECRRPDAALGALKAVAGASPVVFCCEPAYEGIGRRLLEHGADDYVIFPPDPGDLEKALGIPAKGRRPRWVESPIVTPTPTPEEIARLAELLPRMAVLSSAALDGMAALICCALAAESATVIIDGCSGRCGEGDEARSGAALIEPLSRGEQRVGQIRVGASRRGGFTHEDTAKLRHYGVLFSRMLDGAGDLERWRRLASTDELTGLPNRRRLMEFLAEKLAVAEATRTTVTVLVFDIDDFKRYNDQYGHAAGDEILREIGSLFVQCSRATDLVARYGGDEFVVVFWEAEPPRFAGSHHPREVLEIVQRFRRALQAHTFPRLGGESTGQLTISGGLAQYPWQARNPDELIAAADAALIHAKSGGKNRFYLTGTGDVRV